MSQQPEARPSGGGKGFLSTFTNKIGPMPMWVWLVIIAGILIAWRLYEDHVNAASTSTTATDSTAADQVPQFVNQTYTTTTAPTVNVTQTSSGGTTSTGPPPSKEPPPLHKPPPKGKQTLTRNWTAPKGGVSTLGEIAQRLTGRNDVSLLTPANTIAKNFMKAYDKNHNAKVPKGAVFTYTEGTVTDASKKAA